MGRWRALAILGRVGRALGFRWVFPIGTLPVPFHPAFLPLVLATLVVWTVSSLVGLVSGASDGAGGSVVGLVVGNLVRPGAGMNIDPATLDPGAVSTYTRQAGQQTLTGFVLHIIPDTWVGALAGGEILQVLFVAILFGVALAAIGDRAAPVIGVMESVAAAIFKVVGILMKAGIIPADVCAECNNIRLRYERT